MDKVSQLGPDEIDLVNKLDMLLVEITDNPKVY